jgi:hypothetical protein
MSTSTPSALADPVEDFRAAWVAELDRLEVDVELAEAMLAADRAAELPHLDAWAPPEMRAPLPSDLEPRARLVLERQLAVAYRMTERLTETGRHRRFTQAVRDTAQPDVPIYLDLTS